MYLASNTVQVPLSLTGDWSATKITRIMCKLMRQPLALMHVWLEHAKQNNKTWHWPRYCSSTCKINLSPATQPCIHRKISSWLHWRNKTVHGTNKLHGKNYPVYTHVHVCLKAGFYLRWAPTNFENPIAEFNYAGMLAVSTNTFFSGKYHQQWLVISLCIQANLCTICP